MKQSQALKFRLFWALAIVCVASGFSQEKFVASYNASQDMVVTLRSSYTNVIFETWNKDKVEVLAFIDSENIDKQQKQALFDAWDFEVLGSSKNVIITSTGTAITSTLSNLQARVGEQYNFVFTYDTNGAVKTIVKTNKGNTKPPAKRTIIIKMPKKTKTDINGRYGEIKMADAFNVKATLNHTPFAADRIDGVQTLINASYAPVIVNHWQYGTLYVKFVNTCKINTLESIELNANSSDVYIGAISKEAFVTGSFGNLVVGKLADNFKRLEIVLRNTDATIGLSESPFTFLFNGKRSRLKHPKSLEFTVSKQAQRILARGFYKNASTNSNFLVNADYSTLVLK